MDRGHRALLSLLGGGVLSIAGSSLIAAPPPAYTPSVEATPLPTMGSRPVYSPALIPAAPGGSEMQSRGRIRAALIDAHEPGEPAGVAERIARMSPEEREAFKRNLRTWQQMPPEERQALRRQANEHNREEILNALKESGLHLTDDQREVFALRYLQERRKVEREIQEQGAAERARRMPEILLQLRREFGGQKAAGTPGGSPGAAAGPTQR